MYIPGCGRRGEYTREAPKVVGGKFRCMQAEYQSIVYLFENIRIDMAPSIPSSIVEIKKDFSFKELPKDYYTPSKCPDSCSKAPADAEDGRIEGGAHAWLTVIGSCLIYFACFGIINSFGFFQTYYQKDFLKDVSASTISFIGTIQILLLNVLAAPAGSIFDAYGLKVCLTLPLGALLRLSRRNLISTRLSTSSPE